MTIGRKLKEVQAEIVEEKEQAKADEKSTP